MHGLLRGRGTILFIEYHLHIFINIICHFILSIIFLLPPRTCTPLTASPCLSSSPGDPLYLVVQVVISNPSSGTISDIQWILSTLSSGTISDPLY